MAEIVDYNDYRYPDEEAENNLVDWPNPPSLEDLKADLEEALPAHKAHEADVQEWLDALAAKQQVAAKPGRSTIVPKVIRKNAEWRYASLSEPFLSTEDLFSAAPRTWEDKEKAIQSEMVLNYQFNHQIDKVAFIDEYVRTGVDEGTIIVKVGWEFAEEEQDVEVPQYGLVPVQDPAIAQQMIMQGMEPVQQGIVGYQTERQMVTVINRPTVEVCDYNNVILDPTCNGKIEDAQFVIFSFETSLSDLKKDGRYSNLDNIQINKRSVLAEPDHETNDPSNFQFKDEPRQKFVVYEYWGYWDINDTGKTEPFLAAWAGDTLIRMEESPFPFDGLPFVLVQHLPQRKQNFGQPDGYLLEDNQRVIGAVTRGVIDILGRSANGQMGVRKDALDVTNSRKFERGDDFKFNANIDPKQAFQMQTYPEIPQSAFNILQLQQFEAESLTGVKAFSEGIKSQSLGESVGGIRSAMDATAKREMGILRRLADGIIQIGRMILAMNGEFLEDQEVIRVTNEEFIQISKDALGGTHDIKLNISTPEEDNQKAQELAFMLQTMGNNMDFGMSQMILADIARLRKMPELSKRIKEYQPQPDPMDQKIKELQIAKLEAEVFNERAKAEENTVDVELKSAKADTERAKARGLHSKADKDDLEFVEQDSGIKQARDLEKMAADTESKARIKELDNLAALDQKAFDAMENNNNAAPQGGNAAGPLRGTSQPITEQR